MVAEHVDEPLVGFMACEAVGRRWAEGLRPYGQETVGFGAVSGTVWWDGRLGFDTQEAAVCETGSEVVLIAPRHFAAAAASGGVGEELSRVKGFAVEEEER